MDALDPKGYFIGIWMVEERKWRDTVDPTNVPRTAQNMFTYNWSRESNSSTEQIELAFAEACGEEWDCFDENKKNRTLSYKKEIEVIFV